MTHSFHWNHTPGWPGPWVRRANLVFQIIHNVFSNWTWEQNTQVLQEERFKEQNTQMLQEERFKSCPRVSRGTGSLPLLLWDPLVHSDQDLWIVFWPGWSQQFPKRGREIENILRKEENLEIHRAEPSSITVVKSHLWSQQKALMSHFLFWGLAIPSQWEQGDP